MPLNKALLGKTYPSTTAEVTPEAVEKYARACNETNPRYFDPDLGGGIMAPPMFAVVATWASVLQVMTDPELHADLLRLLHREQDMTFLAAIRPDDVITSAATIVSIESYAGGESMTLRLDAHNQLGEPIGRTLFGVFIRAARRDRNSPAEPRSDTGEPDRTGEPLISVTQTIDRDQTFRYAEASGDRNPIHLDDSVARMAGLPGIVVHGLCTMAFVSRAIIDGICAGDPAQLRRLRVRFSRPVFPGQSITTTAWAAPDSDGRQIVAFETINSEGAAVIRGGIAEIAP